MNMIIFWHLFSIIFEIINLSGHSRLFLQRLFLNLKNPPFWLSQFNLLLLVLNNLLLLWSLFLFISLVFLHLNANHEMSTIES